MNIELYIAAAARVFSLVPSDLQNEDKSNSQGSHLISEVDDSRARQFHEVYCAKDNR